MQVLMPMNNLRANIPTSNVAWLSRIPVHALSTLGTVMSRLSRPLRHCGVVLLVAAALVSGCESGGGDGGSGGGSVVGTWSLTNGGSTWFILFAEDGSWLISDTADGSRRRVYGSYTVDGDAVRGSMTNPGVGTGEIAATISGDSISLDFIEHWHTPYKHVAYTGTRLN